MVFIRKHILPTMMSVILSWGSAFGSENETQEPAEKKEQPSSSEQTDFQPVAPARLLEWLPKCPETWVLKKSQGQTVFRSHLESHAVREYQVFRVPGKETVLPTDVMVVAIRDTCGQGPLLKPFRRESNPGSGGDLSLGRWGDFPAILVRMGPGKQSLRLLVADRFIIEMIYAHGNNNIRAVRPWLSGCDLKAMQTAEQETRPPILKRVLLEIVDELNPKRNRRYSAVVNSSKKAPAESPNSEGPDPSPTGDESSN